ncbi:metallophosphoesterase family protein [Stagnihabitans tardus]|uniref:Metallophosphoesterase n=1 Tax=Stagnihabitans tardus TaxID=2699202 RepID=A0AAE4YBV2_9RHOB|nr:metallophosphoesterase [Stagnihabitans tardus]NBZ89802.1 metallophosphoesterase [Stagnihabitans tardus]
MTRVLHISDLHFGAVNARLLEPLLDLAGRLQPEAVVVSGDLTQRAQSAQFAEATAFLARFGLPVLAVPGNHDAPLYNLPRRFLSPFGRYRQGMGAELEPVLILPGAVLAGVNTANPRVWKAGRLRSASAKALKQAFSSAPASLVRIAVMHHAPVPAADGTPADIHDPAAVLRDLVAAGTDIVLSGHTHLPHVGAPEAAASILVMQVGTAISTRLKTRWNDVSLVETANDHVTVQRFLADATLRFEPGSIQHFHRKDTRWQEAQGPSSVPDLAAQ